MRPVRLEMQAFGPYRGRESVDFAELGPNRVFLIHGDTGAGKTTILDAVVFALYGSTSGGERSADQMRSDLAPGRSTHGSRVRFLAGRKTLPHQAQAGARGRGGARIGDGHQAG